MILESEAFTLIVGLSVLALLAWRYRLLSRLPSFRFLSAAFLFQLAAWTFTVLEGVVLPDALNLLEHACHASAVVFLAIWAWRVLWTERESAP